MLELAIVRSKIHELYIELGNEMDLAFETKDYQRCQAIMRVIENTYQPQRNSLIEQLKKLEHEQER
jgi:hypothetical protein